MELVSSCAIATATARVRAAAAADLKIETAIAEAAVAAAACGVTCDIFGGFLMAAAKEAATQPQTGAIRAALKWKVKCAIATSLQPVQTHSRY